MEEYKGDNKNLRNLRTESIAEKFINNINEKNLRNLRTPYRG